MFHLIFPLCLFNICISSCSSDSSFMIMFLSVIQVASYSFKCHSCSGCIRMCK
uniref:Uncharacterized protein n=1 Tax=Arundo donax TaxID=35708 RepID=A0A0A9BWQ9_ARUDO